LDAVTVDGIGAQETAGLLRGSKRFTIGHPAQGSKGTALVLEVRHLIYLRDFDDLLVREENVRVDAFLPLESQDQFLFF